MWSLGKINICIITSVSKEIITMTQTLVMWKKEQPSRDAKTQPL